MPIGLSGTTRLTADGAVGTSGRAIRVFNATWVCSGATNINLVLRNGTSATDTVYVQQAGANGKTVSQNWEEGLLFPDGCFFDIDGDVDAAVIEFREELI